MKKLSFYSLMALLVASCTPLDEPTISPEDAPVSGALFSVPSSLTGSLGLSGSQRSPASEALVAQSVEGYYNYARAQVAIGGEVADFVKEFVGAVESTGLIGKDVDADVYNGVEQVRHLWTSLGDYRYTLERFVNVATSEDQGDKQFEMNLQYRMEGGDTEVAGDMTFDVFL